MAANDYSFLNGSSKKEDLEKYRRIRIGLPKPGEPVPDDWFDAGRRLRVNLFRREMPA